MFGNNFIAILWKNTIPHQYRKQNEGVDIPHDLPKNKTKVSQRFFILLDIVNANKNSLKI